MEVMGPTEAEILVEQMNKETYYQEVKDLVEYAELQHVKKYFLMEKSESERRIDTKKLVKSEDNRIMFAKQEKLFNFVKIVEIVPFDE